MSACPLCAEEVELAAERCRHCGEPLVRPTHAPDDTPPLPRALLVLATSLLALGGLRALGFMEVYLLSRIGAGSGSGELQGVLALLAVGAGMGLLLRWRIGRTLALVSAGLAVVAAVVVAIARAQGGTSLLQASMVTLSLPFELLALLATGLLLRRDVRDALGPRAG